LPCVHLRPEKPIASSRGLSDAKGIDDIVGVMYTTWRHDYSNPEAFNAEVNKFLAWN